MRTIDKYEAFGWTILHRLLPAGEVLVFKLKHDSQAANWHTIYTKGHATMPPCADRVPGMSSQESTFVQAGEYPMTAIEDTEWFCLDAKANGGELPRTVNALSIPRATSREYPQGTRLFIGQGEFVAAGRNFTGPKALQAGSGPLIVHAMTDVYGYDLGIED